MATGYVRQSAASIVTGASITAAIFNAEFNQIQSAMNTTTGHNHDGTTGGGAPIPLGTAVSGTLALANGGTGVSLADPNADRLLFWDDSAGSLAWLTAGDGLTISGTSITASPALASISGLTTTANTMIYTTASDVYATTSLTPFARTLIDDVDASAARTTLGLGSIATQTSSSVNITGGTISGITDLAIADGGTGASNAADARTNLGLGTASTLNVGTSANNVVQLDGSGKLPAVDGSQLTNLGLSSILPAGCIVLWSGSQASIPSGWFLCNGLNGTPDLRDRFVVGAGSTYSVGATGGANTVTLSSSEIPSHTHSFSATTDSQGNHRHGLNGNGGGSLQTLGSGTATVAGITNNASNIFVETFSSNTIMSTTGAHTHSISGTTGSAGSGSAHENRPPYYALCYIMKA